MSELAPTPRRRGPARGLTRKQVIQVGLEVMAHQGLRAVSFRTVAMRLGVDPKALYTYVKDKEDLLAGMFDMAVANLDLPREGDERAAADQVVDLLVSLRRLLIVNPDLFSLVRPSTRLGVDLMVWERIGAALAGLHPDHETAMGTYARLLSYTLGSARRAERQPSSSHLSAEHNAELEKFPHMLAFVQAGLPTESDDDFLQTLRALLHPAGCQTA